MRPRKHVMLFEDFAGDPDMQSLVDVGLATNDQIIASMVESGRISPKNCAWLGLYSHEDASEGEEETWYGFVQLAGRRYKVNDDVEQGHSKEDVLRDLRSMAAEVGAEYTCAVGATHPWAVVYDLETGNSATVHDPDLVDRLKSFYGINRNGPGANHVVHAIDEGLDSNTEAEIDELYKAKMIDFSEYLTALYDLGYLNQETCARIFWNMEGIKVYNLEHQTWDDRPNEDISFANFVAYARSLYQKYGIRILYSPQWDVAIACATGSYVEVTEHPENPVWKIVSKIVGPIQSRTEAEASPFEPKAHQTLS